MATKLYKPVRRQTEIDGVPVIVELSESGLSFRLPGKRNRGKISWNLVLSLIPKSEWCKDANRTLRMFLGIPGKAERQARKMNRKANEKMNKLYEENRDMKKKLNKIRRVVNAE